VDYCSILFDRVVTGKIDDSVQITDQALASGLVAEVILNKALVPAMAEVGARFERHEYYIPDMLIAAEAMKKSLAILKPLMGDSGVKPLGSIAIGTIQGDLHDIGKNLVATMLEGNGFKVINLGVDVKPAQFLAAVEDQGADIIAISALLTTTMIHMKEVIKVLDEAGLRDQVKIMIGGAPVTQAFAQEIGAHGFSDNANSAVNLAKKLITNNGLAL
jgi:corrinoid protein of di/trimethylamine methyltransferase